MNNLQNRRLAATLSLLTMATLTACTSVPQGNEQLDQARRDYRAVRNDPRAQGYAGDDLQRATDAMGRANAAWNDSASEAQVNHLAYLASQRAAIVRATLDTRTAQDTVDAAAAQRRRVQLEARTQEADTAQRNTVAAQNATQSAQRDTAMAERDAADARQASTQAQRQTEEVQDRNRRLEERLRELNAQSTPRGLVITLGDVLFDVDRATLRPGGQRRVQQLAAVLVEFPQRTVLIEGHTDSTGSDAHNQTLSSQRADAVRSSLLSQGIASPRVGVRGYGESAPVSGNETAAGRQLNRRVEIVLSDDNGQISTR